LIIKLRKRVSWVVPDGDWSDHPGTTGADGGPSFAAAIANAVGGKNNDGTAFPTQCNYWDNTVVLITWDDWGGFYDDVDPNPTGQNSGYSNGTGQQYVYGFRVPLLVVSKYAKQGYTSGPASNGTCLNTYYCHDFGSILNFIEHAFNLPVTGINGGVYDYADTLVRDVVPPTYPYSLSDFFSTTGHSFTRIKDWKYPTSCFINPHTSGCFPNYPMDPDNDVIDPTQ
jgi:phospholipase C